MAGSLSGRPVSLKELQLPSIASLRAVAALKSTHLAVVRPARIGLGFETVAGNQKSLAQIEDALGGPGRLSLSYSLRLLLDAMAGLGVLHRALSFVHGEVHPAHVVLGEDGVGRLIPVVRAHWVRGEPRSPAGLYYLAPEKLLGDRVDVRADVFSIGVMLWEAIAGQRLLEECAVDDIIARLMGGGVPQARSPEGEEWTEPLSIIAARALAVDPGRRFASIAEMKGALESAAARYLASTPGMVELFRNPEPRARNEAHDSVGPDSQRITLPPHQAPAAPKSRPPGDNKADPATARRTRDPLATVDLEEELTTKPNAAPLPVAAVRPRVSTLLGVPPPFLEPHTSAPEDRTRASNRTPVSAALIITPLPLPPAGPLQVNAGAKARSAIPSRSLTPRAFPPPPAPLLAEPRRAVASSPLTSAHAVPSSFAAPEPSFELVRPRKRRGAIWLALGAAAAIGAFAARPWVAQRLTPVTGGPAEASQASPSSPFAPTSSASAVATPSSLPRPVGIASTPASPRGAARPARRPGPRDPHVAIQDTVDPSIRQLVEPLPAKEAPNEAPAAPEADPAPAEPTTAPPPPRAPDAAPANDADRYGI